MVAFKEEFPYLRTSSGQLFEFSRDWLHAAITRAADDAGYPSWWLTDHVTESIAFYLQLLIFWKNKSPPWLPPVSIIFNFVRFNLV